jgi:hypothetical protein
MSMPYLTAVVTSMAYCPKPPSPQTATTWRRISDRGPGTHRRRQGEADGTEVARHQHRL